MIVFFNVSKEFDQYLQLLVRKKRSEKEDSTQVTFNVQKMSLLNLFNEASHPIDTVFFKTIL